MGDFEKNCILHHKWNKTFLHGCKKEKKIVTKLKKISCRALRREKYPAHHVSRKKILADQKSSISPLSPQKLKCWLLKLVFM